MSTDDLLAELAERGLAIAFVGGNPTLRGPAEAATPVLIRVLKRHREEIVRRLAPPPPREWLWRTGYVEVERPGSPTWGKPDAHKDTAFWWRKQGQSGWQPVPGRNPEGLPLPVGEKLEVTA